MPEYICPKLRCGLGNRLFQTVAAITAAERAGATPAFLLPRMSHNDHGNFQTMLTLFPRLKIIENAAEWDTLEEDVEQKIPIVKKQKAGAESPSIVVLSGFFQNTDNFPRNQEYLPVLEASTRKNAWAIHFRLGDYSILPHYHVELSKYYYYTITQYISKDIPIYLFSDSPERLGPISNEIQSLGYAVTIYNNPDTLQTLKDFASCSAGAIASNSTFAWWASYFAYKNNSPTYKAYFPNRWILNKTTNLFTLPFTQAVDIDTLFASNNLKTFSHS